MESDEIVCEHMSRAARHEIVTFLLEKLGSEVSVAATADVTEMAVRKWINRITHPSNITLKKLLVAALDINSKRVKEIIEEDRTELDLALKDVFSSSYVATVRSSKSD